MDKDFSLLCAVDHCDARSVNGVLQILIDRIGDEHDVGLAGTDVSKADKYRICNKGAKG